MLTTYR